MRTSEACLFLLLALVLGSLAGSIARRGPDPVVAIVDAIESSIPNGNQGIVAPLGFALPDEVDGFVLVSFPHDGAHRMCSGRI
jgi:hypothetical protein